MRLGLGVSVLGLQQIITTWWLKQQISFTVLEARSLRYRGQQGHAPSEGSEGGCFLLSASDILRLWQLISRLGLSSCGFLPHVPVSQIVSFIF